MCAKEQTRMQRYHSVSLESPFPAETLWSVVSLIIAQLGAQQEAVVTPASAQSTVMPVISALRHPVNRGGLHTYKVVYIQGRRRDITNPPSLQVDFTNGGTTVWNSAPRHGDAVG